MSHCDDFEPGLPDSERAELEQLATRLVADRPVPAPAFRGDLRRRLVARRSMRAPARRQAIACLTSGFALLLVAALGVGDIGPLAPTPVQAAEAVALLVSGT
jgi:hypothetical protein